MRTWTLVLFIAGCGAAQGPIDAASDAPAPSSTPIALADAWVDGWIGGARGIDRYDHVSMAGAPSGYYVTWSTDPGATVFSAVTDCSSFSDVLMMRAYGWMPATTHTRPLAEDYYWAIRQSDHFVPITRAADLRVGDTIALVYGTSDAGGDTGHVAWIDAMPEPFDGAPEQAGMTQLAVTIIDSSHGYHDGDAAHPDDRDLDTDCTSDADCVALGASAVCNTWTLSHGTCAVTGVGRGRMRLFVDASGDIAGYSWSTSPGSVFYGRPSPLPVRDAAFAGRDIVIGRYAP